MGCSCCRMIKSYIYDPSVTVDGPGRPQDSSNSSLYEAQRFPEDADHIHKKQGFHNLGYSTHPSPTKLDIDNNHINRLHANNPAQLARSVPASDTPSLYILQPEAMLTKSPPPLHHESLLGTESEKREERFRDSGLGGGGITDGMEGSDGCPCMQEEEEEEFRRRRSAETPDTADEESVLSVDIHTSSTSLSSADTKQVLEERDKQEMDRVSVTDSMVAEALAVLDAATEGEDVD